jgi:RimJ/RimL family protein N-acetyltransferase
MQLGDVVVTSGKYEVRKMPLNAENLQEFWQRAKKYPVIFGKEILNNSDEFIKMFIYNENGEYRTNGLFFVVNDFIGIFYLSDIIPAEDAHAHYTFFDKQHNGREELVTDMLKYVFSTYQFQRLTVHIPNYATPQARHFVQKLGFAYEGKRRKAAYYKGEWYDVNCYGILKEEVLKNG